MQMLWDSISSTYSSSMRWLPVSVTSLDTDQSNYQPCGWCNLHHPLVNVPLCIHLMYNFDTLFSIIILLKNNYNGIHITRAYILLVHMRLTCNTCLFVIGQEGTKLLVCEAEGIQFQLNLIRSYLWYFSTNTNIVFFEGRTHENSKP